MTGSDAVVALFLLPVLLLAVVQLGFTHSVQRFYARHSCCMGPCYSPRWYLSDAFRRRVKLHGCCAIGFMVVTVLMYLGSRK